MIQINLINTYKNSEGKTLSLPEVWGLYDESSLDKIVLLHSRTEIMGRLAPRGQVWVRSYQMNPPDDTWNLIGTRHG